MRRKENLSLKPTRPKTEGKVFTVQSLERILIMNYWEDEKLIGRYCLNTKSGEYASYLVQSGAWSQCKLESLCTGNTSEEVLKAMGERKVTKIRHNDQVVCPGCKKNLIAKNRGEPKANFSVMFLQKMDEEKSIARHFDVHVTWSGGKHLSLSEAARLILPHKPDAAPKIYYNQRPRENYASCQEEDEEIFDDKKNPANRLIKETFLYPEGIASALANTRYEEWTRVFEAMAKAGLALDYNRMMAASGKGLTGMMEYLLKGRFYRLLKESTRQIVRWSGKYWGVLDRSEEHTSELQSPS